MKHVRLFIFLMSGFVGNLIAQTPQLNITFPVERIVFQRNNQNSSTFSIAGYVNTHAERVEARLVPVVAGQGTATNWTTIASNLRNTSFNGQLNGLGGWYTLEVRAIDRNNVIASSSISRVGIGEVFLVGGEVNAQGDPTVSGATIGTGNDRVSTIDYSNLTLDESAIPFTFTQFATSKKMAATHEVPFFWARLGDLLVQRFNVPVAFYGCGVATLGSSPWRRSADGEDLRTAFPSAVRAAGMPYRGMKAMLNYLAARTGMRSVLWLQGETDTATSNVNYFNNIKTVIDKSRADLNKSDLAWMVARNVKSRAQDSLVANVSNVAAGPDIDAISGAGNRTGVVLSGNGLVQAANSYFTAITPTYLSSVNPMMPTFVQNITTTCTASNGTVVASLPVGFQNYSWSNNTTGSSLSTNAAGVYSAKFFDARGNFYQSAPLLITTNHFVPTGQVTLTASGTTTLCADRSLSLTFPNVQLYNLRVNWNTNDTTRTINIPATGSYSALGRTPVGCAVTSNVVSAVINPLPLAPTITSSLGSNFCTGQTATLTASSTGTGNTYNWTSTVNNIRTRTTAPSIDVQQSGQFYARARSGSGCFSTDSTSFTTTVGARPAVPSVQLTSKKVGNANPFCASDSVKLTATGQTGQDFLWSDNSVGQSLLVTGTGAYTVRARSGSGCLSNPSSISNITINTTPPNPSITASGPLTFCSNVGVTLTAAGGNSASRYVWKVERGTQTIDTVASQITTSQTARYTLRTENTTAGQTCASLINPRVNTVSNSTPQVPVVAISPTNNDGSLVYCADKNVRITASGNSGTTVDYVWSNNAAGSQLPITQSGVYSVRARSATGCISNQSTLLNVTINSNPVSPTITTSGPLEFCADANVTLFANGKDASSRYVWDTEIAGNRSTVETGQLAINQTGQFTLKTINQFNCISTVTPSVSTLVNQLPPVPSVSILPINTDNSLVYCADRFPTISATGSPNGYLWSNASTATGFSVTQTSGHSVRSVSTKGCFSAPSQTYNFTINPLPGKPTIVPVGATTVCDNEEVRLNARATSDNTTGFLWSNDFLIPFLILKESGTFTVRSQSDKGCISASSDPVTVVVNKSPLKPTISASGPTTFCENSQVTLVSSVDAAASRYVWSNERVAQVIDVAKPGNYTVQLFSKEGCRSPISEPISIIVNRNPSTPTISAEGSTRFCPDKSVNLVASSDANTSFVWSNQAEGRSISVNKAGQYSARAINENKCESTFSTPIAVSILPAPPAPKISVTPANVVCAGTEVTLASATAGQILLWNQQILGATIKVSQSTIYRAQIFNEEGCSSAPSDSVKIEFKANPAKPIVEQIGTYTLRAKDAKDQNFEWLFSDNAFIKNQAVVKAGKDGTYKVRAFAQYSNNLTCISPYSDAYQLSNGLFFDQQIGVFPNPSVNGIVTIEVAEKRTNVVLDIISVTGLLVSTKEIGEVTDKFTVDLSEFGRGIYFLRINTTEGVLVKRLMYF